MTSPAAQARALLAACDPARGPVQRRDLESLLTELGYEVQDLGSGARQWFHVPSRDQVWTHPAHETIPPRLAEQLHRRLRELHFPGDERG